MRINVRKLLAKLNPRTASFSGGRGGIPEFTPEDISGALGSVTDKIGCEIFCVAWWPDGASLTRADLHAKLRDMLLEEYSRRAESRDRARCSLQMLEMTNISRSGRAFVAAKEHAEGATKASWPRVAYRYDEIVNAVLTEICKPRHCESCSGRGSLMQGALQMKCARCRGRGIVPTSKAWRARQLRISDSAYREVWRGPYEWMYEFAIDKESTAANEIAEALTGELETTV
jgi:hypothetical protein